MKTHRALIFFLWLAALPLTGFAATRQQDVATVQALVEAIDFIEEQPAERLHDMEQAFTKLDATERAKLLRTFKSCYKHLNTRSIHNMPKTLTTAMDEAGVTAHSSHSLRAHDQAKRKFTTLYIASNATTRCFLPDIFNPGREGKSIGILALCIGLLSGAFTASTLYTMKDTLGLEKSCSGYTSIWAGIAVSLAVGGITYSARKNSYTKNQTQRVAQFIEHTWPTIRETITFPEHVVSVLDYLYGKMEAGTFDMDEAINCIDSLLEPGKVI